MEPDTLTVLVVDDDPVYLDLAALILAEEGMATVSASSAAEALGLIEAIRPALILSDFSMPGASGLDLLEATRERWPDIPFILWSGNLPERVALRARELGAHATSKLVGRQLRGIVRSLLDADEDEDADGHQAAREDCLR
jgi:CheY-like chemotaxis protein